MGLLWLIVENHIVCYWGLNLHFRSLKDRFVRIHILREQCRFNFRLCVLFDRFPKVKNVNFRFDILNNGSIVIKQKINRGFIFSYWWFLILLAFLLNRWMIVKNQHWFWLFIVFLKYSFRENSDKVFRLGFYFFLWLFLLSCCWIAENVLMWNNWSLFFLWGLNFISEDIFLRFNLGIAWK